jgi:hypothetical protein
MSFYPKEKSIEINIGYIKYTAGHFLFDNALYPEVSIYKYNKKIGYGCLAKHTVNNTKDIFLSTLYPIDYSDTDNFSIELFNIDDLFNNLSFRLNLAIPPEIRTEFESIYLIHRLGE